MKVYKALLIFSVIIFAFLFINCESDNKENIIVIGQFASLTGSEAT